MVCTANDLLGWKDFPKGLRVLLLDEDIDSANVIKSKLEEMDYVVSAFYSENDALSAISDKSKGFHVAIVEVRAGNEDGRFKFLERAKDLPTIMTSDVNCISTMMKCIALGAVEFLEKPLSEDKLRNIWQHVAHKAFNAGAKDENELLKSEEALIRLEKVGIKQEIIQNKEHNEEVSVESDKYHAPSTPQLKQGMRHVDNEDQTNLSTEKECVEHDGESKFVEITCDDHLVVDNVMETNFSKSLEEGINKPSSNECCPDPKDGKKQNEASEHPISRSSKSGRRKVKVDWSSELHKKFVQAVEQLGVDQAIPSRILELMNVEGLTRHNVASHLQKYRLQRRHILPKESGRKWPQTRHHSTPRNYYPQKPIMAYPPPYHSNQVYPTWPPPHSYPPPPQTWGPPYYPTWHSSVSWLWNPYQETQAETWGCPTIPSHPSFPQNVSQFQSNRTMPNNSFDHYPGDEVIDKVVKEAINKPWLPLPLGLKPPSTESVISELSKQGISTVPPKINGCH
ncbi:two-component response regulator-like APRR2 isoform X1 [Lactuca sativa]|uniref:two-component response regulator-like APRR2 isoform X1 n=1 Tax=Lactuca sativa TaxID=4236 RepID=UPI000CD89E8B|nr:two-component response regulator-like APRR2 isoform X1 [Lactuca sativa]XP_023748897.1 two-component response regulator-like APRR2 isoform X1 [Lactuca sativa]